MSSPSVDRNWFKQAMSRQGLSLREVARKMPLDAGALSKALNSKRKLKPEEIVRLAEILNRPAAEVLEHVHGGTAPGGRQAGSEEMSQAPFMADPQTGQKLKQHPLFGLMKDSSIVAPGVDLTEPADPDWAKVYDDDYDHGIIAEKRDGGR